VEADDVVTGDAFEVIELPDPPDILDIDPHGIEVAEWAPIDVYVPMEHQQGVQQAAGYGAEWVRMPALLQNLE